MPVSIPPINSMVGIAFWLVVVWSFAWKGVALWKSARHNQFPWFLAILVINSIGILEIVYLMFFQKKSV